MLRTPDAHTSEAGEAVSKLSHSICNTSTKSPPIFGLFQDELTF